MPENTQNHKNRLQYIAETFCEKHEKIENCWIRLTLPGTVKSKTSCNFGIPKNPTRNMCLISATKSGVIYACTLGRFARNCVTDGQTNRLNPFETTTS